MGEKRVSLRGLTSREFAEFLGKALKEVNLREIRGFKKLAEVLPQGLGSMETQRRRDALLEIDREVKFEPVDLNSPDSHPDPSLSLDSHFMRVGRGSHFVEFTWRRNESHEETIDWKVMREWEEGGAYLQHGKMHHLLLRRPPNHTQAKDNLFEVRSWFEKVPHENRYITTHVVLERVSVERFRGHFGTKYSEVALDLVWELNSIHRRTLSELEAQTTMMRRRVEEYERLGGAITS